MRFHDFDVPPKENDAVESLSMPIGNFIDLRRLSTRHRAIDFRRLAMNRRPTRYRPSAHRFSTAQMSIQEVTNHRRTSH